MESEFNEKTEEEGVKISSFRSLGEDDVSLGLINSESRTPLKTPLKETEVKFITSDSTNGDAKINIEHLKSAFAGMSKDELLLYVNDPFWKRVRTILFISFWLLWFVMFAAAIAIIVVAPRCEAPAPRKWFQKGPLYEMDLEQLQQDLASNDGLTDLANKLNYASKLQAQGIIATSVLSSDKNGVLDFKNILPGLGTLEDFKAFLAAAKKKSLQVALSFVPNYSSINHEWFNKSSLREAPYENYYIWAPKSGVSEDGTPMPPNNWKSEAGGSAWTWDNSRSEFYYHQSDRQRPDLNFREPKVKEEFESIFSHWLDNGITGFNLDKVQYLLEDPSLQDEEASPDAGATHDEYAFYSHFKTYNTPDLAPLLLHWRELIHNKTNGDGALIITGKPPIPTDMNVTMQIVDLVRLGYLSDLESSDVNADDLAEHIKRITADNSSWNAVQTGGGPDKARVADRFGDDYVDPFNMITLLLPGTPVTYYGDELGLTDSQAKSFPWEATNGGSAIADQAADERSHLSIYKTLAEERASQAVLYGALNVTVISNSTLVLTRWKVGHPGYILVYNVSPENVTVNLSEFNQLPTELSVIALGKHEKILQRDARVRKDSIGLSPHSACVFTFVPA